jgi:hypothetical protein
MTMQDQDEGVEAAATPDAARRPDVVCPFCSSREVELISPFGGQLSTDQYYCRACRSYFERFARDDDADDEETRG